MRKTHGRHYFVEIRHVIPEKIKFEFTLYKFPCAWKFVCQYSLPNFVIHCLWLAWSTCIFTKSDFQISFRVFVSSYLSFVYVHIMANVKNHCRGIYDSTLFWICDSILAAMYPKRTGEIQTKVELTTSSGAELSYQQGMKAEYFCVRLFTDTGIWWKDKRTPVGLD